MRTLVTTFLSFVCYMCSAQTDMGLAAILVGSEKDSISYIYSDMGYNIESGRKYVNVSSNDENFKMKFICGRDGVCNNMVCIIDDTTGHEFMKLFYNIKDIVKCDCKYNGPFEEYYFRWCGLYIEIAYENQRIYISSKLE